MSKAFAGRVLCFSLALSCGISHAQSPIASDLATREGMRNVIVILRDQMPEMQPVRGLRQARARAVGAAESELIAPLQQSLARKVKSFRTINAFATVVTPAEAASLESDPRVQAVVPDKVIRMPHVVRDAAKEAATGKNLSGASPEVSATSDGGLCNTLEPEALQLTHTAFLDGSKAQAQAVLDGHGRPVTGRGVKVAFLADGLDTTIQGFVRPDGTSVFFDYQNFDGDPAGTSTGGGEAFGDASSIAAQDMPNGTPLLFDISQFVSTAHPLPYPCNIRIRGMAPGASLAGLDVFSSLGYGTESSFVQAIEWAVLEDDVDVINESFGSNVFFDSGNDPTSMANTQAVRAGVTVVVSTGDSGSASTLGSPATDPDVIAAGGSTSFRLYEQTAYGVQPFAHGYLSDNISSLSSGGFAQNTPRTVDVVAPGDLGWALCSTNTGMYEDCGSFRGFASPIEDFGGTSEAAPLTSGAAALVIQAYRSTHHDASPSPALVKQILMSTATDLGAPSVEQGAGLINALAAVQMALGVGDENGNPKNRGDGLLIDKTSAEVVDKPDHSESLQFSIRNTGTTKRHIIPHLEKMGASSAGASLTLTLDPSTDPTFINVTGSARPYITQTFDVPKGSDYLSAAIAFPPINGVYVNLGLIDPKGRQAAYSLPQGAGNGYGRVDVVKPVAGTWTAILYGRPTDSSSTYKGPVQFTWATQNFASFGSVSPAKFDLEPGETKDVTVKFNTPSEPGDMAAALRFTEDAAEADISEPEIPITVRTLVPIGSDFSGTLTGGNGRSSTGPSQSFEFDVPEDAKDLSLGLNVADSGYALAGFLVDPHGMQLSVGANLDPLTGEQLNAMQLYHESPQAGRWHFILLQNYTSSGNQTSLPFTAQIKLTSLPYSLPGMPNEASRKLQAGKPVTVPVTVTNTSAVTQVLFADVRLRKHAISSLPLYLCSYTNTLPGLCIYTYVPPEVNDILFLAQSNVPIELEADNSNGFGPVAGTGSPELFGRSIGPDTVAATLRTHEVPWSYWVMSPSLVGPFGDLGAQPAPVDAGVAVNMRPFDPTVTSDSGDAYADLVLGTNTFNPLVLAPGASGVIHLTVTPDPGEIGKVVKGYVYLDNFSFVDDSGDEVTRIPYAYTVAP